MASVLVLCPTFDHADTLYASVGSLLAQAFTDWELAIVLDGAPPKAHAIAEALAQKDSRINIYSFPKSPRFGEEHRDAIIRASDAEFVCHLGDDDLYLPDHLDQVIAQLENAEWTTRGPLEILDDGCIWNPRNFGTPALRAAMAANRIKGISPGITNTAYRRSAYLRLPEGWTCAPWEAGTSDMFMWAKFFRDPALKVASNPGVSVLRFPSRTPERMGWTPERRATQLMPWLARLSRPGLSDELRTRADLFKRLTPLFFVHGTDATAEATLSRAGMVAVAADETPGTAIDGAPMMLPLTGRQHADVEESWLFVRAFAERDEALLSAAEERFAAAPEKWLWAARSMAGFKLDSESALYALERFRERFPDTPEPLRLAIRTLVEESRLDEARQKLEILRRGWPRDGSLPELRQLVRPGDSSGQGATGIRGLIGKWRHRG